MIELQEFSAENADLVLSWRNAEHVRSLNETIIEKDAHLGFVEATRGGKPKLIFCRRTDWDPAAVPECRRLR
jgi:hypothetical protein